MLNGMNGKSDWLYANLPCVCFRN